MSDSFVTPRSVASQTPLSMGFPSQEYWSELPFPSWPKDPACFSCTGRRMLYRWAPRGAQINYESESESRSVVANSLRPGGLYSWWNSPGQNTGVGSLSRLQGIFPTQGSNQGLPLQAYSLPAGPQGKSQINYTSISKTNKQKKSSRLDAGWVEICKLS